MSIQRQMTVYALTLTKEFRALTTPQATFVMFYAQSFLDTGEFDRTAATKFGYKADGENARTMGYQVVKNPKIRAVINLFLKSRRAA